jgi:hypothetical protein
MALASLRGSLQAALQKSAPELDEKSASELVSLLEQACEQTEEPWRAAVETRKFLNEPAEGAASAPSQTQGALYVAGGVVARELVRQALAPPLAPLRSSLQMALRKSAPELDEERALSLTLRLERICEKAEEPWRTTIVVREFLDKAGGEFLERTQGALYAAGAITARELTQRALRPPRNPRQTARALLYQVLGRAADELSQRLSLDWRAECAREIERSCYNATIAAAQAAERPVLREWKAGGEFEALYSARCGVVVSHLDPCSSVVQAHGPYAFERLASGEWSAADVGRMEAHALCPAASEKMREEIARRQEQKVEEATSRFYACPKCKARHCTYREVQTRSLDEPATIQCRCLSCGHHWNR